MGVSPAAPSLLTVSLLVFSFYLMIELEACPRAKMTARAGAAGLGTTSQYFLVQFLLSPSSLSLPSPFLSLFLPAPPSPPYFDFCCAASLFGQQVCYQQGLYGDVACEQVRDLVEGAWPQLIIQLSERHMGGQATRVQRVAFARRFRQGRC